MCKTVRTFRRDGVRAEKKTKIRLADIIMFRISISYIGFTASVMVQVSAAAKRIVFKF